MCENHNHCHLEMLDEINKILNYNHGETSMRITFILYADLEPLLKKGALVIMILKSHQQVK